MKRYCFSLVKKTNVLTIPLLFQYETNQLVHRHSSKNLPVNLSNYFTLSKTIHSTRSTINENLQTPLFRLRKKQKFLKVTGAKIWNSIPSYKRKSSFRKFKKMFKTYLLTYLIGIVLPFDTQSTNRMVQLTCFIY